MAQCVIDPQSSLVLLLARRVNSAIRERGFRDPHSRNSPPPWSRIATLTRLLSRNRLAAVVATLFTVKIRGLLDTLLQAKGAPCGALRSHWAAARHGASRSLPDPAAALGRIYALGGSTRASRFTWT